MKRVKTTSAEEALRLLFANVRQDACPMGCVDEHALLIACDRIDPQDCHAPTCPWGIARATLRAVAGVR